MGASRFPSDAHDEEDLFRHAEAAMREAKDDERGSTCYAQGFHLARPMRPERIPAVLRGE